MTPDFTKIKIESGSKERPSDISVFKRDSWQEITGFSHGFTTRHHGFSPAPYATLNFSESTGDSTDNVELNKNELDVNHSF